MEKQSKKDLNIMYKRILVPTDGTPMSEKAVEGAAALPSLSALRSCSSPSSSPYSYTNLSEYRPESIEQYDERVTAEAKDRLADAKRRCDEIGVPSTTLMVKSFSPAEAIIEQSKKHDCDVVFMASHGRQGFAAVLLGSETQKVLTHSQIPVMVYR